MIGNIIASAGFVRQFGTKLDPARQALPRVFHLERLERSRLRGPIHGHGHAPLFVSPLRKKGLHVLALGAARHQHCL